MDYEGKHGPEDDSSAFNDLAKAFERQFGVELELGESRADSRELQVTDSGPGRGVNSVGSVRANWLRRNAQNFGFSPHPTQAGLLYVADSDSNELASVETPQDSDLVSVNEDEDEVDLNDPERPNHGDLGEPL